jgi:two-component system sensor histidine kinase PilS (NtrC family)
MSADRPGLSPAPAGAAHGPGAPVRAGEAPQSLFKKLVWLTLFRLAMVTVLLGATAAYTWREQREFGGAAWLYGLVLATYLVSLIFAVLLRLRRWLGVVAYAQIALDVAIAAGVVAVTGYTESVFVFMFLLGIVNGGILLYRRGAIAAACLALAGYVALVLLLDPHGRSVPLLTFFVHASAFVITAALASYLAEQLRSTGERLQARESDLAAITALHEAIVQSVEAGLLTVDGAGRVSFLNRAGEQITGLSLREVCGHPAQRWFPAFQGATRRDETDFTNVRGEKLRLGYDTFPLVAPLGSQLGWVVIFQDLTRLRAMEAAMQRSARLAELGRVAAGLAHELRNPLASMSGSIELLASNLTLAAEDRRLMEIVVREASRLNGLMTRFLDFTRPIPLQREPADLSAVLAETIEVFSHSPSASEVKLECFLEPAQIECDGDQMRQVFWNLLVNAAQAVSAKAQSGSGRIEVRCGPTLGGGATIKIADEGIGIASADLAEIFTPFFTTKEEGTGLGLAIVERIIDAHGGVISVDSVLGQGTTFVLMVPADGGRPAPTCGAAE